MKYEINGKSVSRRKALKHRGTVDTYDDDDNPYASFGSILVKDIKPKIQSISVQVEVVGKTTQPKGLIFKRTAYIIALKFMDSTVRMHDPFTDREVSFAEYCSLNIGDVFNIIMYTHNQHTWFYNTDEAEFDLKYLAKDRLAV